MKIEKFLALHMNFSHFSIFFEQKINFPLSKNDFIIVQCFNLSPKALNIENFPDQNFVGVVCDSETAIKETCSAEKLIKNLSYEAFPSKLGKRDF